MQTKRISVIDLGTNTFNLLVAEWSEGKHPNILHRSKYPTKIGKGGINQNKITDEAIQRAKNAFDEMNCISEEYNASEKIAFATSAIRSAANGEEFVRLIEENYQVNIEIISGEREADLIYTGTKNAVELNHEAVAILDIGGGSNEIIIANNEKVFWKKSYPLGMTRLLEMFAPSDPMTKGDITKVDEYLKEQLPDLFEALDLHNVKTLIGSSGSFDTFKQILLADGYQTNGLPESQFEIKLKDFFRLHQIFLNSSLEERKTMKGMDPARVELMVVASIFINHLVKEAGFSKLYQSSYALKEGALFEHIEKNTNKTATAVESKK
ncbi:Ppx/GppA phosphatase family protein [Marinifilum flexuosum]|uniref:Exopolyphosphatase/guanosine-5'-triphosphate, 3'-diphosphate pyrophosphatase n=1 Tax=Marinifilum flexuosum TaxID=1117708 RepID=A0A419X7D9_9BACT|nr:phosphatase [Marinifilum flexuosum]RKE03684.1 exopolyphosphatase/guanosine-5'-triphosphate,3'-diphosphate pyrophosphatase [Marinifilum flexuosum]